MLRYAVATLAVLCCSVAGDESSQGKWMRAGVGRNPFMVWFDKGTKYVCGGALVDESWVITSAQCASKGLENAWVGDYNNEEKKDGEERRPVLRVVTYPGWDGKLNNDMAMVQIQPSTKTPVRVPGKSLGKKLGGPSTPCFLLGWGKRMIKQDYKYVWRNRKVLQYIGMDIADNTECKIEMRDIEIEKPVCTYSSPEGPCVEDIGNPMVCAYRRKPVLLGVQTMGSESCQGGYNAITTVMGEGGWIRNTIKLANSNMIPNGRQCVPDDRNSPCADPRAVCTATARNYRCLCSVGFKRINGMCVDTNAPPKEMGSEGPEEGDKPGDMPGDKPGDGPPGPPR